MRRTSMTAAAVGLVLTAALLPAQPASAATTTVVQGLDTLAQVGVRGLALDCTTPGAQAPGDAAVGIVRTRAAAQSLGDRALGWTDIDTRTAVGVVAAVPRPTEASVSRVLVNAPQPGFTPIAVATYRETGDDGLWRGTVNLTQDTRAGWHQLDASNAIYTWRHYTAAGSQDEAGGQQTLAAFSLAQGGDGQGAELGFALGCSGTDVQLDGLEVGGADAARFDFEGYTSSTSLKTSTARVTFGRSAEFVATTSSAGDPRDGRTALTSKVSGARSSVVRSVLVKSNGLAIFSVRPRYTATYVVDYQGSDPVEASRSTSVRVVVAYRVTATRSARTVVRGDSFRVSGRALPGPARLRLQRKSGNRWTTVRTARATKQGRYSIAVATRSVGTATYRVVAVGTARNASATSKPVRVTVVRPTPGNPGGGSGGGGGGTGGGGNGGGGNGGGGGGNPGEPGNPGGPTCPCKPEA